MKKILIGFLVAAMALPSAAAQMMTLPDFTTLAEKSGDAVVSVVATREDKGESNPFRQLERAFPFPFGPELWNKRPDSPRRSRPPRSFGSGFIIDAAGYIITNAHVIDGMKKIIITLKNGEEYEAEVVGRDKRTDIALLKIDAAEPLPIVEVGDSDGIKVGQWVAALGSPYGLDQTLTAGIISALGRRLPSEVYVPFIQTDAAVNPGNSGGPLMDLDGKVIGVNSQIISPVRAFVGASFAIPINVVMKIQARLRSHGIIERGRLGVVYTEVSPATADAFGLPSPHGALIHEVVKDSAADQAGLQSGDIILRFNGNDVDQSVLSLPLVVGDTPPGSTVTLSIWRDGEEMETEAVLDTMESLDEAPPKALLGMDIEELDNDFKSKSGLEFGVRVAGILRKEAPEDVIRQFHVGDVITHLLVDNRRRNISSRADLEAALEENDESTTAFFVWRQGRTLIFTIKSE